MPSTSEKKYKAEADKGTEIAIYTDESKPNNRVRDGVFSTNLHRQQYRLSPTIVNCSVFQAEISAREHSGSAKKCSYYKKKLYVHR